MYLRDSLQCALRQSKRQILVLRLLWCLCWCICLFVAVVGPARSEEDAGLWLRVTAPYLDVHTGPGRGYPVDQVVTEGDYFQVLRRRTDWLQIQYRRGGKAPKSNQGGEQSGAQIGSAPETTENTSKASGQTPLQKGWISAYSLERVRSVSGNRVIWSRLGEDAYFDRQWELGVGTGSAEGGSVLAINGARYITRQLSVEIDLGQSLGRFSENDWLAVRLVHQAYPRWSVTPFVGIGFGAFYTKPKVTLAQAEDRVDDFWQVAIGVKAHVWRSFLFRVDYQHNAILTSRANNEFVGIWRAGVGYFF